MTFSQDISMPEDDCPFLFRHSPQPMVIYECETRRILRVNDSLLTLVGCCRNELQAAMLDVLFLPEDQTAMQESVTRTFHMAQARTRWRLRRKDGSEVWVEILSQPLPYQGHWARLAIFTDMTEQNEATAALLEVERSYRSLFENALDGIFQTTPEGRYLRANPALARIYGYPSPEALIEGLQDISAQLYVDPARRGQFQELMDATGEVTDFESQIRRRDGSILWISEQARAVRDATGTLLFFEGSVQDITGRKSLEAEREQLLAEALERADHDPLTGLLNHRAFQSRYGEEAARAARNGTPLAVAVLDLDNFNFFNDAYGHAVGDEVLRQVADALRGHCRSYDALARYGGDEFALLMPGAAPVEAARLMERLQNVVAALICCPAGSSAAIPLSASTGLAHFPDDGPDGRGALETAQARLARAKTGGSDDTSLERLRALLSDSLQGFSMLDALVTAVDNKDRYTRRHSEDVMRYSAQIARAVGMDEEGLKRIQAAALLHDVGKIGVPDRILRKPGALTEEEFEAVKHHPLMGAVIVGAVAGFEGTLDAIRHHHERWDGGGYPHGLCGEETPPDARILAVADAFSAMTMDRPYRKGKPPAEAMALLESGAGSQWDPACVAAFVRARSEWPFPLTPLPEFTAA